MTQKRTSKALSKEAILSKAKELFSQKGYRGTTLSDITNHFGISPPALYYYFKSKEDILLELHSSVIKKNTSNLDNIIESSISTKEKFNKIIDEHIKNTMKDADLHRAVYLSEMEIPKRQLKKIKARRKEYTKKLVELFKKGIDDGEFKNMNAKIAVYLILGACNWIPMWYNKEKYNNHLLIKETLLAILNEGYGLKNE